MESAPCLRKFLADATLRWPNRLRISDGILGDPAHQARKSDHNFGNAVDLTHDPANGVDCNILCDEVKLDPRVTYVIWNGRIYKARQPERGWQDYHGANPHNHHMHVSIHAYARDDLSPWPWTQRLPYRLLARGDRGPEVGRLQERLRVAIDGIFGYKTEAAVKIFQAAHHLRGDGIVDEKTWEVLDL